jgi:peptidyl-prolyl cis-trans isomerase C
MLVASGVALVAMPARSADPNAVVVQVGRRTVSVSELERRWQALPAFQRHALGDSTQTRLLAFIDRWLVPDLLMEQVEQSHRDQSNARIRVLEKSVLQQVLVVRLRAQSETANPVTDADVTSYFESHRQQFDRPERLRLFRILMADEKSANELIQKLKNAPDFDTWRNMAREKSLDRATNMRGGELGFISADGKSDIVELQVDPALFAAAAHIKDGELARKPIREGDKFAVLWRRGHLAAESANLTSVDAAIRLHLKESRVRADYDALLSQLRNQYVRDLKPERLEGVTFQSSPGDDFSAGKTKQGIAK